MLDILRKVAYLKKVSLKIGSILLVAKQFLGKNLAALFWETIKNVISRNFLQNNSGNQINLKI